MVTCANNLITALSPDDGTLVGRGGLVLHDDDKEPFKISGV